MDSEFPSNSRKAKDEDAGPVKRVREVKKVERVANGTVVRRKRSLGKRFADNFAGDNAQGVWSYVLFDVMIPAVKDMVADASSTGIERMLFGDSRSARSRGGRGGNGPTGNVSYNRYSSGPASRNSREESRSISRRSRASHDFDEIILATRVEAEEVIDRLFELVSKYDSATVADLYDLVGIDGKFTDDRWGWSDLRGSGVSRVRNGYLLDLPKPEPLE